MTPGGPGSIWSFLHDLGHTRPRSGQQLSTPVEHDLLQLYRNANQSPRTLQAMLTPTGVDIVELRHYARNGAVVGLEFSVVTATSSDSPQSLADRVKGGVNGQPNVIVVAPHAVPVSAIDVANQIAPDSQAVLFFDSGKGFLRNTTDGYVFGGGPIGPDGSAYDSSATVFGANTGGIVQNGGASCCSMWG